MLTAVAFLARWGIRFRLVGEQLPLLLAVSCWAFGVSCPSVVVEAMRAPIVFDNGNGGGGRVPADLAPTTVQATLEQLQGNLRGSGRSSDTVVVRLRGIKAEGDGLGRPVILEVSKTFVDAGLQRRHSGLPQSFRREQQELDRAGIDRWSAIRDL